jgi:predicted enzyme related to lactoylglutathione lyase
MMAVTKAGIHDGDRKMPSVSLITLYVNDPQSSAAFYQDLFGLAPIQSSPTFVMFSLPDGAGLGLWSRHTVVPPANAPGGGEVAFEVPDADAAYEQWLERGQGVAQKPADAGFGRNFVALDPDGHRLRFFTPAAR